MAKKVIFAVISPNLSSARNRAVKEYFRGFWKYYVCFCWIDKLLSNDTKVELKIKTKKTRQISHPTKKKKFKNLK